MQLTQFMPHSPGFNQDLFFKLEYYIETTFSVSFFFFVFSGAAVVAWGWQLIPGERRLLYQIVPEQQPTAPGRISVKSCWKSIGKPPHKIPLQLLIWAKTCCLYFGPLSSRIFDCHWQETSSLSLHLNFTNINVTPSTLWKIICDQPHTHLNILGGSSRQIIKHLVTSVPRVIWPPLEPIQKW